MLSTAPATQEEWKGSTVTPKCPFKSYTLDHTFLAFKDGAKFFVIFESQASKLKVPLKEEFLDLWLWLPKKNCWDTVPNVCKISYKRHVISCIWVPRVQIYPGWISSYCQLLSGESEIAIKCLTQKDHLHILKVYFRRSALLSHSSKSLSNYQPTWKGGGLTLT